MRFTYLKCFVVAVAALGMAAVACAHPGSGIVVDKYGQVYFTDTGEGVWKIDTHGKLSYIPASKFHWMAIDEAGSFAGSEKSFGEWFERVTPQSSKPVLIMCSDFPLTVNRDGNIYYADTRRNSGRIVRRTPDGRESVVARDEMFQGIAGIAASPDGSLYVTDDSRPGAETIRRIAMDGAVSTFAGPNVIATGNDRGATPAAESASSTYCRGLAVDSQGVVYVAATGSRRVLKITPQGKVSTILQAPGLWSPTGVTVFRGEVYVLEWRDAPPSQAETRKAWLPRVRKVARDGTVTTLATVVRS